MIGIGSHGGYGSIRAVHNIATVARSASLPTLKEILMQKTLTAFVAAATVAAALTASATDASAQRGFGVGLAAGLVGGAIIGGALASRPVYAAPYVAVPPTGFVAYPGYAVALPGPNCYWTRMPVYDPYGRVIGWRGRPVAVCS